MSTFGNHPFGLRDMKVTNSAGDTQVDLPVGRTLSVSERIKSGELMGDDQLAALVAYSEAMEWSLEAGGIDLDAYALMTGRTVSSSGSTPNQVATLTIDSQECYPYFKIYGKAVSDGCTDDIHVKLYKCKLLGIEGRFQEGEFFITSCNGIAIDDGSNGIADFVQNETAASLPSS